MSEYAGGWTGVVVSRTDENGRRWYVALNCPNDCMTYITDMRELVSVSFRCRRCGVVVQRSAEELQAMVIV